MKLTDNVKMLTLAGLLVVGAGAASARGPDAAERFGKIDVDGNGEITQEEITAHGEARFKAADTDGDGFLSADEINEQAKMRHAKRASKMLDRLDTNGDGKLAPSEMKGRRDPAKMFAKLDKDGNGTISQAEFEEGGKRGHRDGKRKKNKPATE